MAYPTKIRYGLRMLLHFAFQERGRKIPINAIAEQEGISEKYLEQIVNALRPLKLLRAYRGAYGGYVLIKDPADIQLGSLFSSLGGLSPAVPCLEKRFRCSREAICTTKPFWQRLDAHLLEFFKDMTLADIMEWAPRESVLKALASMDEPNPLGPGLCAPVKRRNRGNVAREKTVA